MSKTVRRCYGSKMRTIVPSTGQREKVLLASAINSLVADHYVPESDNWTWNDVVNPVVSCSISSSLHYPSSSLSSPDATGGSADTDLSDENSAARDKAKAEASEAAPIRPFARGVPKTHAVAEQPKVKTREEKDLAAMARRRKAR